jgi:hypothetical protein
LNTLCSHQLFPSVIFLFSHNWKMRSKEPIFNWRYSYENVEFLKTLP